MNSFTIWLDFIKAGEYCKACRRMTYGAWLSGNSLMENIISTKSCFNCW